jgi:hypothetical protein
MQVKHGHGYHIVNPTYYQFGAYQLRIELLRALFLDGEDKPPCLKKEDNQAWTLNALANTYSLSRQPRHAVPLFEMVNALLEKSRRQRKSRHRAKQRGRTTTGHWGVKCWEAHSASLQ